MSPGDRQLELTLAPDLARIAINRPEAGNRFSTALLADLASSLDVVATAGPILLVLEGRGEDFCLGREATADRDAKNAAESLMLVVEVGRKLRELNCLVLSSVQGRAVGLGAGLVLHSDLAVAAHGASLAFDEVKRGFPPTIVMSYLENHLPRKLARELVCTGRELGADEAKQLGLINRLAERSELARATERFARELLAQPHAALSRCKPFFVSTAHRSEAECEDRAVDELVAFLCEHENEGTGTAEDGSA